MKSGIAYALVVVCLLVVIAFIGTKVFTSIAEDEITAPRVETAYRITYIEGMPCLILPNDAFLNGITCDWSKWQGNTK